MEELNRLYMNHTRITNLDALPCNETDYTLASSALIVEVKMRYYRALPNDLGLLTMDQLIPLFKRSIHGNLEHDPLFISLLKDKYGSVIRIDKLNSLSLEDNPWMCSIRADVYAVLSICNVIPNHDIKPHFA